MNEIKTVVLVGSGNVAEALAAAIAAQPALRLVAVAVRNATRGAVVAAAGHCPHVTLTELPEADLYLLAVSDRAVAEVAAALQVPDGAIIAHTAGCVPLSQLPENHPTAVCYPLQTFTAGRAVDFATIPLFVEGSDAEVTTRIEAFARTLSQTVRRADSAQRAVLHLAAVFACNFPNHLYALAARTLAGSGLDFDLLKPLIAETAAKALTVTDPATVQTGPAVRGDAATQERHKSLLNALNMNDLETIYQLLSQSIWETSKRI